MSRRMKTPLPASEKLLQPKVINPQRVHDQLVWKRTQQKRHYDKTGSPLSTLQAGDVVRMQSRKGYNQLGVIQSPVKQQQSYISSVEGQEHLGETESAF